MITRLALLGLHLALDNRRPVPAWVRQLGRIHPPTAAAIAEVLDVDRALGDPLGLADELGTAPGLARDADASPWTLSDPAWWAGGAAQRGAALAATLALATLVAVVALRSGNGGDRLAVDPHAGSPTVLTLDLPSLPALTDTISNPLAGPSRVVQTALTPAADPAAAVRRGVQRLGEGLEAPLRREWSAIVAEFDALVRLTASASPASTTPPVEPTIGAPSTAAPLRGEPRASVAV